MSPRYVLFQPIFLLQSRHHLPINLTVNNIQFNNWASIVDKAHLCKTLPLQKMQPIQLDKMRCNIDQISCMHLSLQYAFRSEIPRLHLVEVQCALLEFENYLWIGQMLTLW